ncbi:glucose PTS transporter subunit IIA [Lactococcus termiticola]|uniref:Beta-glucoside-specific PTS system IIBC component n=1 Tax=Lactococcus termiticola TaxID=2169526 RepID=A0A2R5HD72_9LACT|nr:glucose PTS transporter subunit IIA [Lactococcus termiticola]GBG96024.1 beta-glucoside-specific PTS system IIBC component [Lactococcus termiticola]
MSKNQIVSALSGEVIEISKVSDPVFAQKSMGDGFAIIPQENKIVSPLSAEVALIQGHAIGLKTEDGVDALLHLGIDTVSLEPSPFDWNVKVGDKIEAGQVIGTADWDAIKSAKLDTTSMLVFPNSAEKLEALEIAYGPAEAGDALGQLVLKAAASSAPAPKKMAQSQEELASWIIDAVGGSANISKVIHCITRLRFTLKDKDKANAELIQSFSAKGIPSITALYNANLNQYQVVIGQAVEDVFNEVVAQLPENASDEAVEDKAKKSKNPIIRAFQVVIGTITGSMIPIIGLLAAGGMINGILAMFAKGNNIFNLVDPAGTTYQVISILAMTPFYFLPVLVGFSAAKQIAPKDSSLPFIGAAVGGFMINPGLMNLVSPHVADGKLVEAPAAVANFLGVTFNTSYFGIPVALPNYAYTIFPIIVGVAIAKPLHGWLRKVLPLALRPIFQPMITFFVAASIVLLLVGPVISTLSSGIAFVIDQLLSLNLGISSLIIGGLYQVLVIFGLHWLVVPLISQEIAATGQSTLNMIVNFTMFAQGVGALTVFFKTRKQDLKGLSLPAAFSAFTGVTEPAIYGITLKYIRVFIMSSIGAAVGAAVAGFGHLKMFGFSGSLIGFPNFISNPKTGEHPAGNFQLFWIAMAVCAVVTILLVWFFGYKDTDEMGKGMDKKNVFKDAVSK